MTELNNKLDKEVPTHAIYSLNTQLNNLFLKKLKNLEVCSFVTDITKSKNRQASDKEPSTKIKSTAVLPYIGLSETLSRCLQQHGVRSVFKSDATLRSHLVRLKDPVYPRK